MPQNDAETATYGDAVPAGTSPQCFLWVFAIHPDHLSQAEIDLRGPKAGTPPPVTGKSADCPFDVLPMRCLDVNMERMVFVESKLFVGATTEDAHNAALAYIDGEGRNLHDLAANAVLYQFAVGSAVML